MSKLSFTKEELQRLHYIVSRHDFREPTLINKLQYIIDHLIRHEKTAEKFAEWEKCIADQKND